MFELHDILVAVYGRLPVSQNPVQFVFELNDKLVTVYGRRPGYPAPVQFVYELYNKLVAVNDHGQEAKPNPMCV